MSWNWPCRTLLMIPMRMLSFKIRRHVECHLFFIKSLLCFVAEINYSNASRKFLRQKIGVKPFLLVPVLSCCRYVIHSKYRVCCCRPNFPFSRFRCGCVRLNPFLFHNHDTWNQSTSRTTTSNDHNIGEIRKNNDTVIFIAVKLRVPRNNPPLFCI